MIRPFTILCFCAFAGAGAWLYQVKHQVATQDRELRGIWREIEQARDRTSILRAEWALLNEPDRLRQVVQRHLPLEAMQPQQFIRMPEMERRLPVAVAFAGAPNLFVPQAPSGPGAAAVMMAAAQVPAPAAPAAEAARAATPAARRPAPVQPAAEAPRGDSLRAAEAPAPQVLAAAVAVQRASRAAPVAPAAQPAPAAPAARQATPMREAPAREVQPAVHVTPLRQAAPQIRTTQAPQPAPTYVSALGGASSLGLGRPVMAPPVPFSSAVAATLDGGLAAPRAR